MDEKERREAEDRPGNLDERGFGLFVIECVEDVRYVIRYMKKNPEHAAVAILARGILRRDLPRLPKGVRTIPIGRLKKIVANGTLRPPHLRT